MSSMLASSEDDCNSSIVSPVARAWSMIRLTEVFGTPVSSRIRSRDSPYAWPHNTSLTMVMSLDIVFLKMPASPMLRAFLAYQPLCHKLRRSCRFKRLAPVFGKTQPFQRERSAGMREKGATERPQAFRYERAPDRYARMPCQYVRLPFHVERTSIRIERMSFRRGRIRGSFRFARDSFQIIAISVPLCAISWDCLVLK